MATDNGNNGSVYADHYYPSTIKTSDNNRKLIIHVKVNETLDGVKNKVFQEWDKGVSDYNTLENNKFDMWQDVKPSDINSTKILDRLNQKNYRTIYTITLPFPNEFNEIQTHSWEEQNSIINDAIKGLGSAVGDFIGSSKGLGNEITTNATTKFGKLTGSAASSAGAIASMIANNAPKLIANAASIGGFRKPTLDPGYFLNYNGSRPREFSFTWDFVPESKFEMDNILNIILNLKKYSAPSTVINGVSLLSPYTFQILPCNEIFAKLLNMNNVVIRSLNVNYSPDGSMPMYVHGMPKHIKLQVDFIEVKTVMSADYD